MANANNGLNIVLLDACRDNPFARSFRNASRGLAIVSSAPTGTFISYSTGPGQVARDGEGRNSPYTKALLQYINEPGTPITNVFMKVRQKLRKETGQVPWELSSLEGMFYFRPGTATDVVPIASPVADTVAEQKKVEEELLRQKAALEEERRKVDEEKQKLAMARPPAPPGMKEIGRDGRFIAYSDGTVVDTKTNLMWAAKDNGKDVSWSVAKAYCESYRGGGYTDWRMPTLSELAGLYGVYGSGVSRFSSCNKYSPIYVTTNLIDISCFYVWSSESHGYSDAAAEDFHWGKELWYIMSNNNGTRALPVRSAK
jgi:hypothetical protein